MTTYWLIVQALARVHPQEYFVPHISSSSHLIRYCREPISDIYRLHVKASNMTPSNDLYSQYVASTMIDVHEVTCVTPIEVAHIIFSYASHLVIDLSIHCIELGLTALLIALSMGE